MCPADSLRPERRNVLVLGVSPAASALARALGRCGWQREPGGEVAAIDEELLRVVRGEGPPLARLRAATLPRATTEIAHRIASVALHEPFVVADPRFLLTLPVWRPLLGRDCAFVCMFDDPARVADHIGSLAGEPDYQGALNRWTELFRSVLDRQRYAGDWLFTSAEQLHDPAQRARLAAFVGATPHDLETFGDPAARPRGGTSIRPAPVAAMRTHAELCRLAAAPLRSTRAPAA